MKRKAIVVIAVIVFIFPPSFSFEKNIENIKHSSTIFPGECKLVMAVGNATAGNYSILLKVRDPARPGWQALCKVPRGYEYDYHHPWFGYKMHFVVERSFIGTTTFNDVPPNITKPGMLINDAGIAFGDADTISYLVNPSRHAWDDFDWLRYAAQSADNIEEAVELLIHVVKKLHATSVAENIFVIDSKKGVVIEADAFNYRIKEIENGVEIQSNYPKLLWNVHLLYPLFTAANFNSTFLGWVKKGDVVRLGGMFGVYIADIGNNFIKARFYPFGLLKEVKVGKGVVIGNFWLKLYEIKEGKARLFLCFKYYEWERKMRGIVGQNYGKIDVQDAMKWARVHSYEIEGLRGMCEGGYEVATVYKIPEDYPDILSCLWFAPNQCSAIFVPCHIASLDIYDAYENGEAHKLAAELLEKYGHENLTEVFEKVEAEFVNITQATERKARQLLEEGKREEAIMLLTLSDLELQMKAIEIEKMWLNASFYGEKGFKRIYPMLMKESIDYASEARASIKAAKL